MKEPKTNRELKQIATDIYDGLIFTDRNVQNKENLKMVFMPIVFGAIKPDDDIGLIYEHLSEASPRGINGMPIFMSFHTLTKEETDNMHVFYDAYKEIKEGFLKT